MSSCLILIFTALSAIFVWCLSDYLALWLP